MEEKSACNFEFSVKIASNFNFISPVFITIFYTFVQILFNLIKIGTGTVPLLQFLNKPAGLIPELLFKLFLIQTECSETCIPFYRDGESTLRYRWCKKVINIHHKRDGAGIYTPGLPDFFLQVTQVAFFTSHSGSEQFKYPEKLLSEIRIGSLFFLEGPERRFYFFRITSSHPVKELCPDFPQGIAQIENMAMSINAFNIIHKKN